MAGKLNITAATRLSEAVSENPFLLLLLEHLEIGLPLQEKSLEQVASEYGIGTELLLTFVRLYDDPGHVVDLLFSGAEVHPIIRYLKNSHRFYSEEVYPGITDVISRMNRDGETGEIMMIERFFTEYLAEVRNHFDYEERTCFSLHYAPV